MTTNGPSSSIIFLIFFLILMSKKEIPFNGDYEDSEEDSESVSSESEEE